MIIPGQLIAIATFPGVIVHEIAHQLFCRLFKLPVLEVCYFRVGNPAGYVVHGPATTARQQIFIAIGPFFVNTVLGAVLTLPSAIQVLQFHAGSPLDYVLLWLGISIAMHSFPSTGDATTMRHAISRPDTPLAAKVATWPLVVLIYVGTLGSVVWLDAAYGVAVALLLPKLLVAVLA